MKSSEALKPSYAPVYAAALYPELCAIFNQHGYALAVHGSLRRDFDIIAIPWAAKVSRPERVIKHVTSIFAIHEIGEATTREHGRIARSYCVGFGECGVDLSFLPSLVKEEDYLGDDDPLYPVNPEFSRATRNERASTPDK